jgi:hypothetical protein
MKKIVTDEKTRNRMTSMLKEDWIGRIEGYYNDIKKKGGKYGINWQEIEYLDFVYKIKVNSIFNGAEYKLVKIKSLHEQD